MKKFIIFSLLTAFLPLLVAQETAATDPLYEQAKKHLIALLNIDTSQPDPHETATVRYIYKELNKHHIDWEFLSPRKGAANLVARIKGSNPKEKPLLLISHLDTVSAGEDWTFPPYKATLRNGKIYGLGATDAKNYTAIHLALFTALKDSGRTPKRDVILLVTSGEESGSDTGLKWLGETHWDKIAPGYALNEGGGIIKNTPSNLPLVFVDAGTKMYMDLKITAAGDAAHSSVPVERNAVYRLSQVMAKLNEFNPPAQLTEQTKAFFSSIAPLQDEDAQTTINLVLSGKPEQKQMAADIIAQDPFFRTQLKDTLNPVNISSGTDTGASAAEASAIVNARLLPGTDPDKFIEEIKNFLGNEEGITIEILEHPQLPFPKPMEGKDDLFAAINRAAQKMWPGAVTVLGMSPASGDSEFLRRLGIVTYGLGPAMNTEEDNVSAHTADEYISEQDLKEQTQFYQAILENFVF